MAAENPTTIVLDDITVAYGRTVAVDGLSLVAHRGEIVGLLGPNGAGKTTTIDVCCGLHRPSAGTATVLGGAPHEPAVRAKVGLLPQDSGLYDELDAVHHLRLAASLYQVRRPAKRIDAVLDLVNLSERRHDRVGTYSGGMRRRLGLARALIHEPKVLLLDEPTLGIDVHGRRALWDYVRDLRKRGVTILITTNYLDEATALCDQVAIIDHGRVRAFAPPDELRRRGGVTLVLESRASDDAGKIASALRSRKDVSDVSVKANTVRAHVGDDSATADIITAAHDVAPIAAVTTEEPSLEDVFISVTGKGLRD